MNRSEATFLMIEEQIKWMESEITLCEGALPTPEGTMRDYKLQLMKVCRSIDSFYEVCPECNGEKKYEREGHDTIDYLINPHRYNCMNCRNSGRVDGELTRGLNAIRSKYYDNDYVQKLGLDR